MLVKEQVKTQATISESKPKTNNSVAPLILGSILALGLATILNTHTEEPKTSDKLTDITVNRVQFLRSQTKFQKDLWYIIPIILPDGTNCNLTISHYAVKLRVSDKILYRWSETVKFFQRYLSEEEFSNAVDYFEPPDKKIKSVYYDSVTQTTEVTFDGFEILLHEKYFVFRGKERIEYTNSEEFVIELFKKDYLNSLKYHEIFRTILHHKSDENRIIKILKYSGYYDE